ncbi:hypothetical protein ECE128010_0267 [Escherichia coli E128010]|nr:hypothetical protein ECE128010_0267 [Escherichia coli E128010]
MRGLFLVPAVAVPVGVCLVRFGGWRGEVGAPQSAEGCHSASHLAQFSKATDPEKFIKIKIARIGLCRRSRSTRKCSSAPLERMILSPPFSSTSTSAAAF